MSFAKVYSAQTSMLKAHIITIEVDLAKGLYAFSIVGLPDKAVEEARDRIAAAIKNSGFSSPKHKNQKVVISLAPAIIKKEGPAFDLGMALAYLLAADELRFDAKDKIFLGELSLNGELHKIIGVLPLVLEARRRGFKEIFVPKENAREAALIDDIKVFGAETLAEVIDHLNGRRPNGETGDASDSTDNGKIAPQPKTEIVTNEQTTEIDWSDIKEQLTAKRGLIIAAAGGHNIALFGPPGTGKTMLARAFTTILPPLSFDEVLEVTAVHSVAGALENDLVTAAPFRSPHHTSSYVSLVGGGTTPRPGEVTLAHRGVLFLDEFPEFDRRVIEALRQPLEDRVISVSRAKGSANFPAHFILIAAMNPCPCGNFGSKNRECVCLPAHLLRYRRKISGPIADRIDMWIEVPNVSHKTFLSKNQSGPKSEEIREKVMAARQIQKERFTEAKMPIALNSEMGPRQLEKIINLSTKLKEEYDAAAAHHKLSGRAYHRVLKLARTIADLEQNKEIGRENLFEALQYRPKETAVGDL